jgi:hypothetical protein
MVEDTDAREPKPPSCDIWGHEYPPKLTTGKPRIVAPVSTRPPRPKAEPLSLPTVENRVGMLAAIATGVFYLVFSVVEPFVLVFSLPIFPYLAALSAGAFRVRPRPRRAWVFHAWFLPILLQLSVYLLLTWRLALRTISGHPHPTDDPLVQALFGASAIFFFTGWIPSLFLTAWCQRGGWLIAAQGIGPFVVPTWFIACIATLD